MLVAGLLVSFPVSRSASPYRDALENRQMLDAIMVQRLTKLVLPTELEAWKLKYPAAWDVLNGPNPIRSDATAAVNLTNLTLNLWHYGDRKKWEWVSGKGDAWGMLEGKTRVQYDCHTIADCLAELAKVIGYGAGKTSNVLNIEPPTHNDVFVIPLRRLCGGDLLLMFGGEGGYPSCGGHHVWSDHRIMQFESLCYDAMLKVTALPVAQVQDQYVEWYGIYVKDPRYFGSMRWKPDRPGKPAIYYAGVPKYTFQEMGIAPGSVSPANPLGSPMPWNTNPAYQSPWVENPLYQSAWQNNPLFAPSGARKK